MSQRSHLTPLFNRHAANPILSATGWPYPAHTVFNPAATLLADGTTLLLCRVEDYRGLSHLCAVRSSNGVDNWRIDPLPTFISSPSTHPEELWGIEDPRITFVEELGLYAITYTAFGRGGPGVALALTGDFVRFERLGIAMQPDDKDAALLPRRFDGNFAMIHRPAHESGSHIWISYSPDLRNWGSHKMVLKAREGAWWDANKVGLSPPLLETPDGWLMLYHGVRRTASGSLYRLGAALLDREHPDKVIARGDEWIFGPEASYEHHGDVGNVVFPCGMTLLPDGDTIHLYYGAADTSIGLATGSLSAILTWLRNHSIRPEPMPVESE